MTSEVWGKLKKDGSYKSNKENVSRKRVWSTGSSDTEFTITLRDHGIILIAGICIYWYSSLKHQSVFIGTIII